MCTSWNVASPFAVYGSMCDVFALVRVFVYKVKDVRSFVYEVKGKKKATVDALVTRGLLLLSPLSLSGQRVLRIGFHNTGEYKQWGSVGGGGMRRYV